MNRFCPPLWLKNRHIQSVLSSSPIRKTIAARQAREMLKASRSFILDCGDGVRLQGYYAAQKQAGPGLCVLIHGWQGSSDSAYLVSAAGYLWDRGFSVFRLNLRDHGMTHHLNEGIFHSCRLNEVVGAVKQIQQAFGHKRLFLGGFSLGGNFVLRVALKAPAAGIRIERVVAVCPVLSPHRTMEALENGPRIYHAYFMRNWTASLETKYKIFPHLEELANVRRYKRSIRALTAYFVERFTEFPDIDAYLNGYAITGDVLKPLRVPSLIIASMDDPIIPAVDLANLASSPLLTTETSDSGGHCGFLENIRLHSRANSRMAEEFSKS